MPSSVRDTCPKCNGQGWRLRTKEENGTEADPGIHPMIARSPKPCERCGGSGRATLTREEIAARNAKAP